MPGTANADRHTENGYLNTDFTINKSSNEIKYTDDQAINGIFITDGNVTYKQNLTLYSYTKDNDKCADDHKMYTYDGSYISTISVYTAENKYYDGGAAGYEQQFKDLDGKNVTLKGDAIANNAYPTGTAILSGKVTVGGTVAITMGSQLLLVDNSKDTDEPNINIPKIYLEGSDECFRYTPLEAEPSPYQIQTSVVASPRSLVNTKEIQLKLSDNGNPALLNVINTSMTLTDNYELKIENSSDLADNYLYYTVDQYNDPTMIEKDVTLTNILNEKNNVFTGTISGEGNIKISTWEPKEASTEAAVNLNMFIVNSDNSNLKGNTDITLGSLILGPNAIYASDNVTVHRETFTRVGVIFVQDDEEQDPNKKYGKSNLIDSDVRDALEYESESYDEKTAEGQEAIKKLLQGYYVTAELEDKTGIYYRPITKAELIGDENVEKVETVYQLQLADNDGYFCTSNGRLGFYKGDSINEALVAGQLRTGTLTFQSGEKEILNGEFTTADKIANYLNNCAVPTIKGQVQASYVTQWIKINCSDMQFADSTGKYYKKEEVQEIYKLFSKDKDINYFPGLNPSYSALYETLNISNIQRGGKLWLDSRLNDSNGNLDQTNARTAAYISASTLQIGKNAQVYYEGISSLNESAKISVVTNISGNVETLDKDNKVEYSYSSQEDKNKALASFFEKPLVNVEVENVTVGENTGESSKANYMEGAVADGDELTVVKASAKNIETYAAENGFSAATQSYAKQLDEKRLASDISESDKGFYEAMYNEGDASTVNQTLSNLSMYWFNGYFQSIGGVGIAGSNFFNGSSGMDAEIGRLADDSSIDDVRFRGQSSNNNQQQQQPCYQQGCLKGWNISAQATYSTLDANGYTDGKQRYDGYHIDRMGVIVTGTKRLDAKTSHGFVFAYQGPKMNQNGEYTGWNANYYAQMQVSDYQFGYHFKRALNQNYYFATYAGFGFQNTSTKRSLTEAGSTIGYYTGSTCGNTFTYQATLGRDIRLSKVSMATAFMSFDTEQSWLFGFDEDGITSEGGSAILGMTNQAYAYDRVYYGKNSLRFGLNYVTHVERLAVSGGIMYSCQLDKDLAPYYSMTGLDNGIRLTDISSHEIGRSSLTLNCGFNYRACDCDAFRIFGGYTAKFYTHANMQLMQLGCSYQY